MVSKADTKLPKPRRLIPIGEVLNRTALSRSAIYREISAGDFPKAVPLTKQRVAWVESEVEEWIGAKMAKAGH